MMLTAPVYFINQGSIVRGRVDRRHRNQVLTVVGEYYLRPDLTELPIYLGFERKLGHEEIAAEPAPLLALVKPIRANRPPRVRSDK